MSCLFDRYKMITLKSADTNTACATGVLDIGDFNNVTMFVIPESGSHSNHIITLKESDNGADWSSTAHTVIGGGNFKREQITKKYVKGECTTLEGAASTATVAIIATKI